MTLYINPMDNGILLPAGKGGILLTGFRTSEDILNMMQLITAGGMRLEDPHHIPVSYTHLYRVVLERRSAWEILNKDDFDSLDGIDVVNQFFDITPASDIQAIICEYGRCV